ncbi:MAG: hypothetical protein MH204_08315, partial [Fimbriimonadaceae bacterium]|nr:hypothetical protein [Fimbriimonadaceae bacterium]
NRSETRKAHGGLASVVDAMPEALKRNGLAPRAEVDLAEWCETVLGLAVDAGLSPGQMRQVSRLVVRSCRFWPLPVEVRERFPDPSPEAQSGPRFLCTVHGGMTVRYGLRWIIDNRQSGDWSEAEIQAWVVESVREARRFGQTLEETLQDPCLDDLLKLAGGLTLEELWERSA